MATTDENGNFYFEKIKPGKYIVRIKHEDYEKFIDEVEVTNADINNFKFELNPLVRYGKIIGEIRNEDGDLVGNAQIIIGNNQPIEVSGGKFVAENIIRGKYKLIVYADGYEPYEDRIIVKDLTRVRIILKRDTSFRYKSFISKRNKGKSEEKEIPATKGYGSVEGMIRDEDTLKPIKGVTVSLAGQYMVTGEDGMYYFNKIIPGQYSMSIIAKGYGVYAADIYVKEGYGIFNISLKKNENESVLYGKVYEKRTNRPIEGARVYVGRDLCKTDKSGFFSFKVKQDDYVELKVYIGKVLMYKKIVYIKSNRVKHDVFLEVE
jgi:protocatechuate 3,4-dioxygenase beta subunit